MVLQINNFLTNRIFHKKKCGLFTIQEIYFLVTDQKKGLLIIIMMYNE